MDSYVHLDTRLTGGPFTLYFSTYRHPFPVQRLPVKPLVSVDRHSFVVFTRDFFLAQERSKCDKVTHGARGDDGLRATAQAVHHVVGVTDGGIDVATGKLRN